MCVIPIPPITSFDAIGGLGNTHCVLLIIFYNELS